MQRDAWLHEREKLYFKQSNIAEIKKTNTFTTTVVPTSAVPSIFYTSLFGLWVLRSYWDQEKPSKRQLAKASLQTNTQQANKQPTKSNNVKKPERTQPVSDSSNVWNLFGSSVCRQTQRALEWNTSSHLFPSQ